jgi:hypothetical protein
MLFGEDEVATPLPSLGPVRGPHRDRQRQHVRDRGGADQRRFLVTRSRRYLIEQQAGGARQAL